jgi:ATP-dependent DNA helicase RecQ
LGYLAVDPEGFGGLQLTDSCRPILKGEQNLALRRDATPVKTSGERKTRVSDDIDDQDQPLWEALREVRRQLAVEHNLAPFMVFHDKTLKDMLSLKPQSLDELHAVSGVGDSKLERYGSAFLAVFTEPQSA